MNKLGTALLLLLLLVILPAGSWIYLKKGADYRKQIMKELENKTPFNDTLMTVDSIDIPFKNKCTLLSLHTDEKALQDVYRQFKEAKGFQLIAENNADIFRQEYKKTNAEIDAMINNSYKQINKNQLIELQSRFGGKDFVLIDSLNQIRNTYTKGDMTKLINHIPPLLPYYDQKKGR